MIFEHAIAADLHSGRKLAALDGELAFEYPELADLLEGRELTVHARHGLLNVSFGGLRYFRRVHRNKSRHVGQSISDENNLIDDGLGFEELLDSRGIDFLAVRGNDQLLFPAGDIDVTLGIDFGDIAGVKPAIAEHSFGGGRVAEVTGEERRAFD